MRTVALDDAAQAKKEIQRILREIVIKRDKKCQLCGVPYGTEGVVFQCDHLISRSSSATYADSRLCVLICKSCHGWKSVGANLRKKEYDRFMHTALPKERVELWDKCEADSWRPKRTGAWDWKMHILLLNKELATYV